MKIEKKKPNKRRVGGKISYWGKQGFGGYPGVKHTAKEIVKYIPIKKIYVEPFAGLGRTAEYIKDYEEMILNDKSEYALQYLRKNFIKAKITNMDFKDCMLTFDSHDTVFFMDPPWVTNVYEENSLTFCDRKAADYYDQIIDILPSLKGDWVLASAVKGVGADRMKKCQGWFLKTVESKHRVVLGKKAKTLLMFNKKPENHRGSKDISEWFQ